MALRPPQRLKLLFAEISYGSHCAVLRLKMGVKIKHKGAARRRRPAGEHNFAVLSYTKKIIFIFFGLAARAVKPKILKRRTTSRFLLLAIAIVAIIKT